MQTGGDMRAFFEPGSVAVIGASRNPKKIGHIILVQMMRAGFSGRIYPINPKADEIAGLKAYPSVRDVDGEIDLAITATPAQAVPEVLNQCGEQGVRAVVVISGGFSEVGNVGLEHRIAEIARRWQMRLMGPNCMGVYSPSTHVDTLFTPEERVPRAPPGNIAMLSQSGSVAVNLMVLLAKKRLGVSRFVSYGNGADVDEADLISYLAGDEETEVIGLYVEGMRDGRRFIEAATSISAEKPIVVLKAGLAKAGLRAVKGHTGALAGRNEVYEAAFRQSGVMRTQTLQEFLDACDALSLQPPARGKRVGIVTNGGGYGVTAVDVLEREGLVVPPLGGSLEKKLKEKLPAYYTVGNPLDLTGSSTWEQYRDSVNTMSRDPGVDALLVIALLSAPLVDQGKLVDALTQASSASDKPIVVVSVEATEEVEANLRRLRKGGVPHYTFPDRGAKALAILVEYGRIRLKSSQR